MPLDMSVGILSYLTGHEIVKIMDHSEKLNSILTKTHSQQDLGEYNLYRIELKHEENVLAIAQEIEVINNIIFFLIKKIRVKQNPPNKILILITDSTRSSYEMM